MDIALFRAAFPEFSDEVKYPDPQLTFWSTAADALLNVERWGALLTQGRYLFVAHNIALAAVDVIAGDAGRTPGLTAGVITNKTVGGVSISYDANSVMLEGAGNYNMTKYGREFWQLMNIVGMGGYQV